jgi:flagellar protein FlbD
MISLTRFNQAERIALNPDLIERVEETPDTVVTLTNGTRYLVSETIDEIVTVTELHKARILALAQRLVTEEGNESHLRLLRGIEPDGPPGDEGP